jgi:Uma2 family endonuclease
MPIPSFESNVPLGERWSGTDPVTSRFDALHAEDRDEVLPLCPDFVIELRLSSDRLPFLQAKMSEYRSCGAQLAWLIDPLERRVWVYQPGRSVERLEEPAFISAEPFLPAASPGLVSPLCSHTFVRSGAGSAPGTFIGKIPAS